MPARNDAVLMPDDTDRRPATSAAADADPAPPSAPNILAVVARRWPLLLLGVAAGLVLGFLYHMRQPPVFLSSAQVMVIKKRAEMVGGGGADGRIGYLEDYVAPQLTLLKSELILVAAGRRLRPQDVRNLPDDEKARAGMLAAGLTVARDPNATGGVGGGVLFLSFRAGTPEESRAMLQAVIEAYQEALSTIYDRATRDQLGLLDIRRDTLRDQEAAVRRRFEEERETMRRVTEEDFGDVRGRVTSLRQKELALELEVVDLDRQLGAIGGAGRDRRQRFGLYQQLAFGRLGVGPGDRGPTVVDPAVEALEAQRRELATRLGKDHPQIKDVDARLRFYKELNAKFNPVEGETVGERNDELWALGQNLAQKRATADDQLKRVRVRIQADKATLDALGPHEDKAVNLRAEAAAAGRQLAAVEQEQNQIKATAKQGGYAAEVITEPAPGGQVAPVLPRSLALGAVLGVLAGGGLAFLAELADQSFRTPAEVRARLGVPVLGHLPRLAAAGGETAGPDESLVVLHRPKSPEAEAYRGVRTQLYFSTQGRGHQVIQVTSPNPGDGKSTLAANLAASIAQSGKRVVLVDCDLRKPRVHKLFKLAKWDVGMSTAVAGADDLGVAVRPSGVPHLDLLPCGPRPANPAELLTSPGFLRVLKELRASYDFVILDTPPMLAVSDPAVVAPRADGVILVLRMTNRARPAAERARDNLAAVGANVIGVAVNGAGKVGSSYAGYRGSYQYGYQSGYGYQYEYEYQYVDEYADGPESAITPRPPKG